MERVNEVEWEWSVTCPNCATTYSEYDEQVNCDGTHPIVICDGDNMGESCNCTFEVTCIEC